MLKVYLKWRPNKDLRLTQIRCLFLAGPYCIARRVCSSRRMSIISTCVLRACLGYSALRCTSYLRLSLRTPLRPGLLACFERRKVYSIVTLFDTLNTLYYQTLNKTPTLPHLESTIIDSISQEEKHSHLCLTDSRYGISRLTGRSYRCSDPTDLSHDQPNESASFLT